jgi:hypothetical protein
VSFCAQFLCALEDSIAAAGQENLGPKSRHQPGSGEANATGTARTGDQGGGAVEAKRGGIHAISLGSLS